MVSDILFPGDHLFRRAVARNLIKRYNQRVLQLFLSLSLEPTPGSITSCIPLFCNFPLSNLENCRFRRQTLPHRRARVCS